MTTYQLKSTCDDAGNLMANGPRTISEHATREEAEAARQEWLGWYADRNVPIGWGCLSVDEYDDTITEIAAILIAQGPTFSGGTDELTREGAAEWDDCFDGDVDQITQWIEAGYWNPSTAASVRDEGHRPSDRPTIDGECAIYALCNRDVDVDDVQW